MPLSLENITEVFRTMEHDRDIDIDIHIYIYIYIWDSLVAQTVKRLPAMWEAQVRSPGREDPREKETATHSVLLPRKSHGWRSLVGYSPWGRTELDTTERLHFHFSLSCIGEGNGNPLQCSCLENPRYEGA